ncbi:5'-3' exonuclease [Hydrogenothermus marinus]|uniref:DNA polymerase-1 n=1 Tax=Hydrogenothermus marinus TaxID=133270 RepID=A0A3M0BFH2_9AQUI|nr:5'-3' exonuclease H3TH domain-containing protein [Hydrogenothermus marinus]RMA96060.1 DNA polymerase-1 [Hydrogenothermus marinus]
MKKIALVDGSSYIYRAFYALPPLTAPDGRPTGAIYGFLRMILKLINDLNPEYIAVIFDKGKITFRTKQYEDYKATRKETPDELKQQIPEIKRLLKLFGIKVLEKEGFEADDIIATLAKKAKNKGFKVYVVTPDKDMMQLVSENIYLLNPVSNIIFDKEKVKEKYGVYPEQFIDYQALVGDTVDNIIGVKGVGPKTASKLLNQYGNIENILNHLDELSPKLQKAFQEAIDRLEKNRFLVKLDDNVPLDIEIENLKREKIDWESLIKEFEKLGFKSLLKEIGNKEQKYEKKEKSQRTLF